MQALPDIANSDSPVRGWPDDWCEDWYVSDGLGGVEGPLPAAVVFAGGAQQFDNRPGATSGRRFVARRGFAQWYDANDFAGLWSVSSQLSKQVATIQAATPVEEAPTGNDDEILRALAMTGVSPSALAAPVSWQELVPEEATAISPRAEAGIQRSRDQEAAAVCGIPLPPRMVWLAQRARSRLGDLRHPVAPAFLTVLTLGVYYTGWLLGAMREVVWHMDHDTSIRRHVAHPWMAWLPGFHVKATWDLACLIRAMEEQDGYTSTRPVTAAMLSVFPPLASIYLQHALNDHWLVHCLEGAVTYLPMQKELNTTSSTSSA